MNQSLSSQSKPSRSSIKHVLRNTGLRRIGFLSLATILMAGLLSACSDNSNAQAITVYKSPTCGCCKKWITHLENNGFKVTAHDTNDVRSIKQQNGVGDHLASCHTALVNGYVIEGHVPADTIKRLLKEKPIATGLAAPGMPMGSPGMEGTRKDPHNILLFNRSGDTAIYEKR